MSLTLLVRSTDAKNPPSLTFDSDRVVIGRGAGCDLRLPDPSVSHRHASVRRRRGDWIVVDEGSTNGTFVGGVRLGKGEPHAVKTGDLVRVGRVWLEVKIDQTPPTHDLALATRDLALALVSGAMQAIGAEVLPKVRVVEGPDVGATLALAEEGRPYVLGRGETCDLPLTDVDASREHVQIVRRGGTVLVRDRRSKNGALLGEVRLATDRDVPWKSNMLLCVGKTLLALDEPTAVALAELEQADDEPIREGEVEPAPAPLSTSEPPASAAPEPMAQAPIAEIPKPEEPEPAKDGRWTATDFVVVFAAIAIIALSLAGLVWLLRS
jgi:pSer/pThr/pTyr-binding forkhead associated (FHA) protein